MDDLWITSGPGLLSFMDGKEIEIYFESINTLVF